MSISIVMHEAKTCRDLMNSARYKHIAPDQDSAGMGSHHAKWMIEQVIENGRTWPVHKSLMWIGYIKRELVDLRIMKWEDLRDGI